MRRDDEIPLHRREPGDAGRRGTGGNNLEYDGMTTDAPWPRYVRAAPCYEGGEQVARIALRVGLMRSQDAAFWQRSVHPFIESSQHPRADRHWDWRVLRRVLPLAQYLRQRRCLALTTFARSDRDEAVPVAMHLLIERYPHLPQPQERQASFLWFLAAAPKEAFLPLGLSGPPPSLGRVCIDTALVASFIAGCEGRIGLHCAAAGGVRLVSFYQDQCKLLNLEEKVEKIGGRRNDGRFFYTESELAESLLHELDELREL